MGDTEGLQQEVVVVGMEGGVHVRGSPEGDWEDWKAIRLSTEREELRGFERTDDDTDGAGGAVHSSGTNGGRRQFRVGGNNSNSPVRN